MFLDGVSRPGKRGRTGSEGGAGGAGLRKRFQGTHVRTGKEDSTS